MGNKKQDNDEFKIFIVGGFFGILFFVIGIWIFNTTTYIIDYKDNQIACVYLNSPNQCDINNCYKKYNVSVNIGDRLACIEEKIGEMNNDHKNSICQPVETR